MGVPTPILLGGVPAGRDSEPAVFSADMDTATAQTVRKMCELIRGSQVHPALQAAARDAWAKWGQTARSAFPGYDSRAWAAWWWAKYRMSFQEDDSWLRGLVGEADQLEGLISPDLMCSMIERNGKGLGDCDDYTMLLCGLMEAMGQPWAIATIKANPQRPEWWSHVYALAIQPDGSRLAMDASHGICPGWEVPGKHVFQYAEWNSNGERIKDVAVNPRMNGYRARGLGDVTSTTLSSDLLPWLDTVGTSATSLNLPVFVGGTAAAGGSSAFEIPTWAWAVGGGVVALFLIGALKGGRR